MLTDDGNPGFFVKHPPVSTSIHQYPPISTSTHQPANPWSSHPVLTSGPLVMPLKLPTRVHCYIFYCTDFSGRLHVFALVLTSPLSLYLCYVNTRSFCTSTLPTSLFASSTRTFGKETGNLAEKLQIPISQRMLRPETAKARFSACILLYVAHAEKIT